MGFTNVAWEARTTEQLAQDLTNGPGPMSVGQAGAAWVRVAHELANVSTEYDRTVEKIQRSFESQGADAVTRKLGEFGSWLQGLSLSAAGNGERAETAAVANSVAVMSMPSVSAAVEAKAAHDAMTSLAAYNGAILNGRFAELDEAAMGDHANASAVMYRYEEACNTLAEPWPQQAPPDVCTSAALQEEREALRRNDTGVTGVGGGAASTPSPLMPFRPGEIRSSSEAKTVQVSGISGGTGASAGMGSGYGPMAAASRGDNDREHETSVNAGTLDGGGDPGAALSATGGSWLPTAEQSEAPFLVSHVSWGPDSAVFDQLAAPDLQDTELYADEPERTFQHVSDRWVAPPVIGVDKKLL